MTVCYVCADLMGYKIDMDVIMNGVEKSNRDLRKEKEALIQERESAVSELSTKVSVIDFHVKMYVKQ